MEPNEVFLELTKHLVNCNLPLEGCQTCHKVFGEKRPFGIIRANFEEKVRKFRKKKGLDTSTPLEVE